jgi:uncharacterized protein YkwD
MILLGGFTEKHWLGSSAGYPPNLVNHSSPGQSGTVELALRFIVLVIMCFVSLSAFSQSKAVSSRPLPSKDEQRLLELVNQERETSGLKPLTWDQGLADAARAHSRLLAQHKSLSHQFMGEADLTKRAGAAGATFSSVGENVGYAPDVDLAHTGFMNSPPHRENILRPDFNAIGIAIIPRGDELYVTQDFSRKVETVSNDQFDRRLIAAFNQLRSQEGLEPMNVRSDARLHKVACAADLNAQKILDGTPGATDLAVFTTSQPDKFPLTMQRAAADKTLHRMDLGVCFKQAGNGGFSTYWVVAAFFPVSN